jgi:hypothetical protein
MLYNGMEEQLKKLIAEKLTRPQIATRLGKSVSQIARLLRKYGLYTVRRIDHNPEAKHKFCRYCGRTKDIECFPVAGIVNGVKYLRQKCNTCYTASKTNRKREIADWLKSLKKQLCCSKCGNPDFRVLDFHHIGEGKEFSVGEATTKGFSKQTILEEIKKCVVLCSNCHRIFHYKENHTTG